MKIKLRNFLKNDGSGRQISTPYLTAFWSTGVFCFGIGFIFGELQFWFGDTEELI
jgi:hypothetical protein